MKYSQSFFLKHRLVIMNISRDLLVAEPGQRLNTIEHYIKKFHVSRGTIQMAMQYLIEKGCISTQFCGHLGTFLLTKNMDKLWEFAGIGNLTGAMPIPLDKMSSGLATGVCDCMRAKRIPFNCIFIHGSNARVKSLLQGKCDFVVVTRLAHEVLKKTHNNIKLIINLTDCRYTTKYALLFKDPGKSKIENGMTVAIDPTSIDQSYLTKLACKKRKSIQFIQTPSFLNTRLSVAKGEADVSVVIYSAAQSLGTKFQAQIKEIQLSEYNNDDLELLRTPVILVLKDNYGLDALLKQTLDAGVIFNSQKAVMAGTILPNYY